MSSNNKKVQVHVLAATEAPPDGYKEDTSISVSKVFVAPIENLASKLPPFRQQHQQQQQLDSSATTAATTSMPSHHLLPNFEPHELIDAAHEVVLVDAVRKPAATMDRTCSSTGSSSSSGGGSSSSSISNNNTSRAFLAAGPRQVLHFCPRQVNAAIVTAGGLCPGINNVIRELVHSLHNLYGVNQVWGITGGWQGFHRTDFEPILLTNAIVEDIHLQGGSFLRSSRGGLDINKTVEFLQHKNISQLYIVGGDGTHRAACMVHEACMERNLNGCCCWHSQDN